MSVKLLDVDGEMRIVVKTLDDFKKVTLCYVECVQEEEALEDLQLPLNIDAGIEESMKIKKYSKSKNFRRFFKPSYYCAWCDKKVMKKKYCTICRVAMYCGKTCQTKDWPKHKKVCKKINKP